MYKPAFFAGRSVQRLVKVAALAACGLFGGVLQGSNYPGNYCDQVVRTLEDGPSVYASISSGCGSQSVIGYKNSGLLAAANPDSIEAIIVAGCAEIAITTVVEMGREWNGTGYMSEPFNMYARVPEQCYRSSDVYISYAFSDGENWDSRFGANYGNFPSRTRDFEVYQTGEVSHDGRPNLKVWDHIINVMRR